jgi:hypothetical protein
VIALVIVVGDEGLDLGFEITEQIIIFKQDTVLERLMPALDLALGHGVISRATDMLPVLAVKPFRQVLRDAGAIVGEKPWPMNDCLVESRGPRCQVQRGSTFRIVGAAAGYFIGVGSFSNSLGKRASLSCSQMAAQNIFRNDKSQRIYFLLAIVSFQVILLTIICLATRPFLVL